MSPTFALRARAAPRPRRHTPTLEPLEPRALLSAVSWTGVGDGKSWIDANNWSGHAVPSGSDDVTITASGSPTIQIASGTQSVHSLTSSDPLSISGGSLSVAANSALSGGLTMTGGSLTATGLGVVFNVTGTTAISGASLNADRGASLALPNLTSYVANFTSFQADGAGSVLDLHALTTVTQLGNWAVSATTGGTLNLSGLTALNATHPISLQDTDGSTLLDPNVTTLTGVNATLDGSDAQVASSWTKFRSGTLIVNFGAYSLPALTDVDQSNLTAGRGASLALPNLTSYVANSNTLQADGAGSILDLHSLTTVTQLGNWYIDATTGGTLNISGLTALSAAHPISVQSTGNSALLDPNVTTLTGVNATLDGSDAQAAAAWTTFQSGTVNATQGAVTLPAVTGMVNPTINLQNGGALKLPVLATGSITLVNGQAVTIQGTVVSLPAAGSAGATINVPATSALTVVLQNNGTLTGGTAFNVGQGTTVVLSGGTYTGGATFNVATGATVDLTNGQNVTYGGTLTGTGAGTVLLATGGLHSGSGAGGGPGGAGLTLNFPGSMFQWTGGTLFAAAGNVTNLGTVNLAGAGEKEFFPHATLYNEGTIIQSASGNLGLHGDNVSPATLLNDAGASYLIESDAGIDSPAGGQAAVQNAGTIRKAAGSGTSTLSINGALTNTGTIEAAAGTLDVEPKSISQVSGTTLTAGTWNALNGAKLKLPATTTITSTAAAVVIDGPGAAVPALAGLNANSGSLALTNGASFATAGDFTNSGSLTIGGRSTFRVNGNDTQTAAATLGIQIAGAPATENYGQVVATKTAALAGTFNLALVGGFTPTHGQDFKVMSFARSTGAFATSNGLGTSLTEFLEPSSLELVAANPALQVVSITPSADFLTSLPNSQFIIKFNHPVAGLTADKADGTGFAADPFAVMLIPSGPDGLTTQKATGVYWSAPGGVDAGDLPVPATAVYHVNDDGTSTITLTVNQPLATDVYLLSIGGLSDTSGHLLANDLAGDPGSVFLPFNYRPTPFNLTAPQVVGVTANNGAVVVNNNRIPQPDTIGIAFSKPMDTYTINAGTVQLFQQGVNGAVPAAVAYSPTTQSAYLTPETRLAPGAVYYVVVSGTITDDQGFPAPGVPLGHSFMTSFTVSGNGAGAGTSPLTVLRTNPLDGTAWTAPLGYGAVTLSEPIALASLGRFSAMLVPQTGSAVRGAGQYADIPINAKVTFNPNTNQLIIVPTGTLRNGRVYLFSLSGLQGANGDALAGTVYSTFLLNAGATPHVATDAPLAAVVTPGVATASAPTLLASHRSHAHGQRKVLTPVRPPRVIGSRHVPAGPRRLGRGR